MSSQVYSLKILPTVAKGFARDLKKGDVVMLHGDLGAGKTTFVKHLVAAMGGRVEDVTSPTFNLAHIYDLPNFRIQHFDLYRIKSKYELNNIGFSDDLSNTITIIEWGNIAKSFLSKPFFELSISFTSMEQSRLLTVTRTVN
jgi:tRNA threonylcarbamoyladenosine biosynthesis protein TsaE